MKNYDIKIKVRDGEIFAIEGVSHDTKSSFGMYGSKYWNNKHHPWWRSLKEGILELVEDRMKLDRLLMKTT